MMSSTSILSNQFILLMVQLWAVSESNAFATLSTRRRPTFEPIIKVTTMQSSTQEDNHFQISNMPQRSNSQYFEKSMAIDILLPPPSSGEAQQQDSSITEDDSKSDQKLHAHLDEDEMADLLDHADHASGEIQQMMLSSDYGAELMMSHHHTILPALKPLIEYLAGAGLIL